MSLKGSCWWPLFLDNFRTKSPYNVTILGRNHGTRVRYELTACSRYRVQLLINAKRGASLKEAADSLAPFAESAIAGHFRYHIDAWMIVQKDENGMA